MFTLLYALFLAVIYDKTKDNFLLEKPFTFIFGLTILIDFITIGYTLESLYGLQIP